MLGTRRKTQTEFRAHIAADDCAIVALARTADPPERRGTLARDSGSTRGDGRERPTWPLTSHTAVVRQEPACAHRRLASRGIAGDTNRRPRRRAATDAARPGSPTTTLATGRVGGAIPPIEERFQSTFARFGGAVQSARYGRGWPLRSAGMNVPLDPESGRSLSRFPRSAY